MIYVTVDPHFCTARLGGMPMRNFIFKEYDKNEEN